jgi:nicotinate-nucleotide adenylyltransferase
MPPPSITPCTTLIDGPMLEISSSDLRRRLAAGQPTRYQLPDPVVAYIEQNGLYRNVNLKVHHAV